MPGSTARYGRSMSSYGRVLAASSQVLAARWEPFHFFPSHHCRFCSKFAYARLLSLSSPLTINFFQRNDKYGQELKISSKCPTSAIAFPDVKYVKEYHEGRDTRVSQTRNERQTRSFVRRRFAVYGIFNSSTGHWTIIFPVILKRKKEKWFVVYKVR